MAESPKKVKKGAKAESSSGGVEAAASLPSDGSDSARDSNTPYDDPSNSAYTIVDASTPPLDAEGIEKVLFMSAHGMSRTFHPPSPSFPPTLHPIRFPIAFSLSSSRLCRLHDDLILKKRSSPVRPLVPRISPFVTLCTIPRYLYLASTRPFDLFVDALSVSDCVGQRKTTFRYFDEAETRFGSPGPRKHPKALATFESIALKYLSIVIVAKVEMADDEGRKKRNWKWASKIGLLRPLVTGQTNGVVK